MTDHHNHHSTGSTIVYVDYGGDTLEIGDDFRTSTGTRYLYFTTPNGDASFTQNETIAIRDALTRWIETGTITH